MLLYKLRDFSAFFQDTFSFLKQHGKHFFKHFLTINGIFIIILMAIGYIFMKFYMELLFGGLNRNDPNVIDQYLNENLGSVIIFGLIFFIIAIIAGMIQYAFVPIYLKEYEAHNNTTAFGSKEILAAYKKNAGKLGTFLVTSILLAIPILILLGIGMVILFVTIIGALAVPFLIGLVSLFYYNAFSEYLNSDRGVWDCFSYSRSLISTKFRPAIGSVGLFIFMSYILQNVVTLIGYFFGIFSMVLNIEEQREMGAYDANEATASVVIVMAITFMLSSLLSILLNTIVMLNQGVVFYSLKEEKENINTKSVIDQIGTSE